MERYFIFDKYNTWYDWRSILTAKDIPDAEPKTNYVELDGRSGALDLSEVLTGEITYKDRTISATFWTNEGTRDERERLLRDIRTQLHGKKIKIIEPDDPAHYFYGRVKIKSSKNTLAYTEFTLEATCEPWRYALEESIRTIGSTSKATVKAVINNTGAKTLSPVVSVKGTITLTYNGRTNILRTGDYKISDFRVYHGLNVVEVYGDGSVTFTYREADL